MTSITDECRVASAEYEKFDERLLASSQRRDERRLKVLRDGTGSQNGLTDKFSVSSCKNDRREN